VAAVRQIVLQIARAEHQRHAHADWRSFEFRREAASRELVKVAAQVAVPM
jgi:hypothetical protein